MTKGQRWRGWPLSDTNPPYWILEQNREVKRVIAKDPFRCVRHS